LIADRKSKVKEHQVRVFRADKLCLIAPDCTAATLSSSLQIILKAAPEVIVAGIPSIARAVIQSEDDKAGKQGATLCLCRHSYAKLFLVG
jgi:hypothetical protein